MRLSPPKPRAAYGLLPPACADSRTRQTASPRQRGKKAVAELVAGEPTADGEISNVPSSPSHTD
jgi:hypothetical protein